MKVGHVSGLRLLVCISQTMPPRRERKHLHRNCRAMKNWMDNNRLKMNASKTEYIYFGSSHQLANCKNRNLDVNGEIIERSKT